ncbi:tetratricopeptide repeat protein [bacterium]
MARINYSDNIDVRGRNLHLQTNTFDDETKIVSTLFDGGRILVKEESRYNPDIVEEDLIRDVEEFHKERKILIDLLYAISARVKTVRHTLSLNKLGLQYLRWNLLDEAISEFELAIQYDDNFGEAYVNLGEAYLRRGGLEEALKILKKGVQIAPKFADMWQKLGIVHFRSDHHEEAIRNFQKALKINPNYDESHFYIAMCLMDSVEKGIQVKGLPDHAECKKFALEHLSRAANLSKRFQTPMFEEAMRVSHKGDFIQSRALLQEISTNLPKVINLDFHDAFYLNFMYGDRGRNRKTIQKYVSRMELLLNQHPDFPDLHNKLGIGYLIQCRDLFNSALEQFQSACRLNPEYKRAKKNLKLAQNDGKGFLILLRAMLK